MSALNVKGWLHAAACVAAMLLVGACTLPDVRVVGSSGSSKDASHTSSLPLDAALRDAGLPSSRGPSNPDGGGEPQAAGSAERRAGPGGSGGRSADDRGAQAGFGGSGVMAPKVLEDDAGVSDELSALLRQEYAKFREAQKRAIDLVCERFLSPEARMVDPKNSYEHRMACEANWGLHQPGQAKCVVSLIEREPIEAIPVVQCRVAVFESLSRCLAFEFRWSDQADIDALNACMRQFDDSAAGCVKYPMWLREQVNVCYERAEQYWAYVDMVYAQAQRVCSCFAALGYDSLEACQEGEGIVYSEFAPLETCFSELDGQLGTSNGDRASASAYFTCDQMRMTEYGTCMSGVSTCDPSGAMRCKNLYRVDRAVCRNEAHFLRDPYEACGQ